MVIVKVNAGLCNQMYFFATAYALAREWGDELAIDPDIDGNPEWTYLLDEFNVPFCKKIVYPLRYNVGGNFIKMPLNLEDSVAVTDESNFEQDGEYLTIPQDKFELKFPDKIVYLKGAFLKRQMFTKYLPEIREIFTLKKESLFVQEFEKKIENVTAIGVHIRKQGFAVLGDDNGIDYFMAAIVFMRAKYEGAKFFVFSDDLESVKIGLGTADDIFYVDAMNGFRGDIEEFICLTKCHHYILTRRSTYGRMAEILNARHGKTSVLFGENTWNDPEDRFFFLAPEEVKKLSRIFVKKQLDPGFKKYGGKQASGGTWQELLEIGLDSGTVSLEGKRNIIFQKAKCNAADGEYGQAVHLCRLLEEQYGVDDENFHEYFGDILCQYGRPREAAVEYICAAKKKALPKKIFKSMEFSCYKKLLGTGQKKKHYVIAQYGPYTSQYVSQMQMIGLILGRMGNDVSFILKKGAIETLEDVPNAAIMEWNRKIDSKWLNLVLEHGYSVGRFYYGYPCYDYKSIMQCKIPYLQKMAEKYVNEETIIVGRDSEIVSEDVPFRKVFVDFSEPFDEAYLKEEVGDAAINGMYCCADVVVTREERKWKQGQQVVKWDEGILSVQQDEEAEIPCYEPTLYTEDYLEIALKIALSTI